jgi:hypothetical protein
VHFDRQHQLELLRDERPVDVNDPRNEEIVKKIKSMKSDYLD